MVELGHIAAVAAAALVLDGHLVQHAVRTVVVVVVLGDQRLHRHELVAAAVVVVHVMVATADAAVAAATDANARVVVAAVPMVLLQRLVMVVVHDAVLEVARVVHAAAHHALVRFARPDVAVQEGQIAEQGPARFRLADAVQSHRLHFALLQIVAIAQLVDAILEQSDCVSCMVEDRVKMAVRRFKCMCQNQIDGGTRRNVMQSHSKNRLAYPVYLYSPRVRRDARCTCFFQWSIELEQFGTVFEHNSPPIHGLHFV